jgi:hypothetical protein
VAWSNPVESVEFASATTAATFTFSPLGTIPIGSFLFMFCAANAATTFLSAADNSTQAGAANTYVNATLASGSTNIGVPVYCLSVTRSILATDVITVTFNATASRRDGRLHTWVPPGGAVSLDVQSGAANVAASPLVFASTGAIAEAGSLAVACMAYKSGSVSGFSVPAGYTASGSFAGSGGTVTIEEGDVVWKGNAGTAAEAPSWTMATAPTSAVGRLLVFRSPAIASRPRIYIPARPMGVPGMGA